METGQERKANHKVSNLDSAPQKANLNFFQIDLLAFFKEKRSQKANLDENELLCGADQSDHRAVEIRKVSSIFDWVVSGEHAGHN